MDREPFKSLLIGQDVLIAVSAAGEGGQAQHRIARDATSPVPVLQYTGESGLGRIMHAVVGHRLAQGPVRTVFTAHLASVLRTMALDGRGIAWLPRTLVDEDIARGRLVAAAGGEWEVPLEIRLYRDAQVLGKAAEEFWTVAADS